ncbi:hypothetical protein [Fodinicurvata fenggangensis]|uniref:hypothetical protein n=1 Tax=Fodinicurvata fenggangensis TaxID=1121830 RepID=UPI00047A1DAC|nr:hypothetical protein [Fodinicurvata fenggangensis]
MNDNLPDSNQPTLNRQQAPRELHPGFFWVVLLAWLWLVAAFWSAFAGDLQSAWMVTISTAFFGMYFGLSAILLGLQRDREPVHKSFLAYLKGRMDTFTGAVSGRGALVQVAIIPVSLALAGTGMAIVLAWVRGG